MSVTTKEGRKLSKSSAAFGRQKLKEAQAQMRQYKPAKKSRRADAVPF